MTIAVITGAASGIGKCVALILAERKQNFLCLIDSCEIERLRDVASECSRLGATVSFFKADVSNRNELQTAADEILSKFGTPRVLVVNAGVLFPSHEDLVRRCMEVNYFGAINTIEAFAPSMLRAKQGRIIVSNSIASLVATENSGAYSGSKAALMKYTDAIRFQFRNSGVTITTAILGFVDTPMVADLPHAKTLAIPARSAAKRLLSSSGCSPHTIYIPRLLNIPWLILGHLPGKIRFMILLLASKLLGS